MSNKHSGSQAEHNNENLEQKRPEKNGLESYRSEAERIAFEAQMRDSEIVDILPSGNVAEVAGEGKRKASEPSAGGVAGATHDQAAQALPEIEELRIPAEKIMVRQVRIAIQNEIKEVQKTIKKLEKDPAKHAFELSKAVEMMRHLRTVLSEIAYKSAEFIKGIWLDVMQGKKISEIFGKSSS